MVIKKITLGKLLSSYIYLYSDDEMDWKPECVPDTQLKKVLTW